MMPDTTKKSTTNSNKPKMWLLKEHDFITGPFTKEEVHKLIENGQISYTNSMACVVDQGFWISISYYSEFATWADKLSTKAMNNQIPLSTITDTNFQTQTTQTIQTQTKTETLQKTASPFSSTAANSVSLPYQSKKPSAHSANNTMRTQKQSSYLKEIGITLLIVLIGAGIYFITHPPHIHHTAGEQFISQADKHFTVGYYLDAIEFWRKARHHQELDPIHEFKLKLAELQLHGRVDYSSQLLELEDNQYINSATKSIIQALVELKTDRLASAKQILTRLLQQAKTGQQLMSDEIIQAAGANLALISAEEGHCEQINIDKLHNIHHNYMSLLFVLCSLQFHSSPLSHQKTEKWKSMLQNITRKPQAYYQEALLALAYINLLDKNHDQTQFWITKLLDSNPYLTSDYYHSILVDTHIYYWPQWLSLCESIYHSKQSHKIYITLYAYCLTRAGQATLAQQTIDRAIGIDSKDTLIKTIKAYMAISKYEKQIEYHVENPELINFTIDTNKKSQSYKLPYILKTRFCKHRQDWKCMVENWKKLESIDPLSAYGGIAYAEYRQANYKTAKKYLDLGSKSEPYWLQYKPLHLVSILIQSKLYQSH